MDHNLAQRIVLADLEKIGPMTTTEINRRLANPVDDDEIRHKVLYPLKNEGLIDVGSDNYWYRK